MHCNTVIPLQKQNKISVWHELNFHPGKKKKKAISHSLSVCWLLTVSRFRVPDLWCYISHSNASFQLKPSLSELWLCESRVTLRVWESNREIRPLWNNMSNVLWRSPPFLLFTLAAGKTLKSPSGGHQPEETAAPDAIRAENQAQKLNPHKSTFQKNKKIQSEDTQKKGRIKLTVFLNWLYSPPPPHVWILFSSLILQFLTWIWLHMKEIRKASQSQQPCFLLHGSICHCQNTRV